MEEVKENSLITELHTIAKLIGEEGRQAEFYRQMIKDAKPIKITRLSEIFTRSDIEMLRGIVRPKECFRNATLVANMIPDVKYVEGKMTCCGLFGIDHAWNKIGDNYIDVTMELAIKRDPLEEEYIALGEWDTKVIVEIIQRTGYYGDVYSTLYNQKRCAV